MKNKTKTFMDPTLNGLETKINAFIEKNNACIVSVTPLDNNTDYCVIIVYNEYSTVIDPDEFKIAIIRKKNVK